MAYGRYHWKILLVHMDVIIQHDVLSVIDFVTRTLDFSLGGDHSVGSNCSCLFFMMPCLYILMISESMCLYAWMFRNMNLESSLNLPHFFVDYSF